MTRILIVVNEFPAISETFVLDQITFLLDRGFDLQILASKRRDEAVSHAGLKSYDLPARSHYADWRHAGSRAALWRLLSKQNVKLGFEMASLAIGNRFGRRSVSSPRQLLAFAFTMRKIPRPDLVLCHFGVNGDLMVRLRAALSATWPIATIFHGYDITSTLQEYGTSVYDRLLRESDLLLPVSEFFRQRLLSIGASATKIQVQRVGVRPQAEAALRRHRRSSEDFIFVIVGRLVEKKGHQYAIDAISRCRQNFADTSMRVICIGEGPLMQKLSERVASLGLENYVEFRGSQPRDVVMQILINEADVFILPSVTAESGDMEGIPVAISEAMSLGLPVISTFHSGIPELVVDGKTGLLAMERDVPALCSAMLRLSESPDLALALGEAGRRRLETHFNLDRWNDQLAEKIKTLLATSDRAAPTTTSPMKQKFFGYFFSRK